MPSFGSGRREQLDERAVSNPQEEPDAAEPLDPAAVEEAANVLRDELLALDVREVGSEEEVWVDRSGRMACGLVQTLVGERVERVPAVRVFGEELERRAGAGADDVFPNLPAPTNGSMRMWFLEAITLFSAADQVPTPG